MLFAVWSEAPFRPTGDVDLLGFGSADIQDLRRSFAEVLRELRRFMLPRLGFLAGTETNSRWSPEAGWTTT